MKLTSYPSCDGLQPGNHVRGNPSLSLLSVLCAGGLILAGCATQQQQQQGSNRDSSASQQQRHSGGSQQQQQQQQQRRKTAPAPVPMPAVGAPAQRAATCTDATGGLIRMSKTMPGEAVLGGSIESELRLTAEGCAADVVVRDVIPANASYVRSEPPATVDGNTLTWRLGDLDAGSSQSIKLWLKAEKEGTIVNCASVAANPRTCSSTRVVNPGIELTKTQPEDVTICDPIPVTLVVKNSGSSQLTGVKVTDSLPEGLSADSKSTLVFDVGNLAPGDTKEFKFNATAARAGKFANSAEVVANEGVSAKASASTAVHQAVLAITCKARDEQYMTRPFDVCFTVNNTGDAPAAGTQVVLPVPSGVTFSSATAGGRLSGNNVVWDLGALPANSPQELCASFTSTAAGTYSFSAAAKGTCASQVVAACETRIVGVSALLLEKADDPDPIQIGETTTYTVRVTNQGTADDTNVKVVVQFPAEVDPVSASHEGVVNGKTVTFPSFPRLAPKQAFEYSIKARGASAGDARIRFIRTSDGIPAPTTAEESTRVY